MAATPLYTLQELSDEVRRPVKFLRRAISSGLLACHQEGRGATIFVTLEQWDAYLAATYTVHEPPPTERTKVRHRRREAGGATSAGRSRRDPTRYVQDSF